MTVYRIGTGTGNLVGTGSPVFLDEYTPAGVLVQSVALPEQLRERKSNSLRAAHQRQRG
ncbi:MAG TPA: hypothetical protein VG796_26020 [Verrucomicrobiales bacterium]|nr:hypothetical protein [Verrucomicrobiales bacterium]